MLQFPSAGQHLRTSCEALPHLNAEGYRSIYNRHADKRHEELRAELRSCASLEGTPSNPCVKRDALKKLIRWLRGFEHSQQWTRRDSYGLKHLFERETGVYVPDGLFTLGALMAGFSAKFAEDSPTAVFQMRRPAVR